MSPCKCGKCRLCILVQTNPAYAAKYGAPIPNVTHCAYEGRVMQRCMHDDEDRHVRECEKFDIPCVRGSVKGVQSCSKCEHWTMKFAYAITTIPDRAELFAITRDALARVGFDKPYVFSDIGHVEGATASRTSRLYTAGAWWLALWELFIREPEADRYAIFQDDLIPCEGLLAYLSRTCVQEKVYWNLYTHRENAQLAKEKHGWFRANQLGKGALALVFSNAGVRELLSSRYMVDRFVPDPRSPGRYRVGIDGGIVCAMKRVGYEEYCHYPSLVQHTGMKSTMGNMSNQTSPCFSENPILADMDTDSALANRSE